LHRSMLHGALEDALGVPTAMGPFLKNESIGAIIADVLEGNPALLERLCHDAGSSGETPKDSSRPGNERPPTFRLADLAYTLQVGREPMDERLAIIADSVTDLEGKLRAFVEGRPETVSDLYVGN